ncbi:hypothetical protein LP418_04160 [Nocardioides sp. B-3]|nr:hypothetical protein LP418_04160 [Nocardioides sp. B-3]
MARIASRPLDRSRPLWEVYFVEGLAGGRFAVLTKSHQIPVDGRETVDIGQCSSTPSPTAPSSATTSGPRVASPMRCRSRWGP